MKCHYTYDEKAGEVLIPGCMAVAISNDIDRCACRYRYLMFSEKTEYRRVVKEQDREIAYYRRELKRITNILKNNP
jgi:hypothetical protein